MSVYLITGAAGYVGFMLTERLLRTKKDAAVVALARNQKKMWERLSGGYVSENKKKLSDGILSSAVNLDLRRLKIFQADLCDDDFMDRIYGEIDKIDYIFHCASVTSSSEMVCHPVEVTRSILNATQNVLELSRHYRIKSMVYLSSMEIYGDIDCSDGHKVTEQEADTGRVETLAVRSCYPLGKRMAENICYSYFKEFGIPVKIARLAQTFGRGILPADNRVFAQFARAVRSDIDIVLHTEGRSMGNYCGIDDVIDGLLLILEYGRNGEAYNVVNEENTMTIRQMAELVAEQVANGSIGVRSEILSDNRYGYAADTGIRLSAEKLMRMGWRPEQKLAEMYLDMLADQINK